jgi:phage-related tail fiber protein
MLISCVAVMRSMVLLPFIAVSACAITEPVVVIGKDGHTLKGTATASLSGGRFSASDGQLTCGGNCDSMSQSVTITMQVLCSEDRKGIVIATREASGLAGHGTVKLNDGSEWTFIFGHAAANF